MRARDEGATGGDRTVLYALGSFPRLTETFILDELLELEAAGLHLAVESLAAPPPEPRHLQLQRLRAPVRQVRCRGSGILRAALAHGHLLLRTPVRWARVVLRVLHRPGRRGDLCRVAQIADRVLRLRACHVHTHFAFPSSEIAAAAAELAGVSFSVHAHAADIFGAGHAPHLARRLAPASAILTESMYNVKHLRKELPGGRVELLRPAVPVHPQAPLPPHGPVLAVARLVPKKGLDVLLKGFAQAAARASGLSLELIGEGPLEGELRELAKGLGISERVRLLGPLPVHEVVAAFERCSMFALPCRIDADGDRDGLPTALAEALAHGVPAISTRVAGIPEIIRHEQTGLLVGPDDPGALALAILRLHEDRRLARALGAKGRELVATEYAPALRVAKLLDVFGVS